MSRPVVRALRAIPKPLPPALVPPDPPPPGTWGVLAEPVDPLDTVDRMRAQSLLAGLPFRDGSSQPPPLTTAQARDVLAWRGVPGCRTDSAPALTGWRRLLTWSPML